MAELDFSPEADDALGVRAVAIIVWRPEVDGVIRIEHVGRSRL